MALIKRLQNVYFIIYHSQVFASFSVEKYFHCKLVYKSFRRFRHSLNATPREIEIVLNFPGQIPYKPCYKLVRTIIDNNLLTLKAVKRFKNLS